MAELTAQDRLQPCLLDRLTDDAPERRVESRERRVVSLRQLRGAVIRDLGWLLNARTKPELDETDEFPLASASVVNFGIPDVSGMPSSSVGPDLIERRIREAVIRFEPRILRGSLSIKAAKGGAEVGNALQFEIHGQMWALPVPDPLFMRTEVDLETGLCAVTEGGHG